MKGLVGKLVMFSVLSVMSIGGVGVYNMLVDEEDALSLDQLANLVSWDEIAMVIGAVLGGGK